MRITTEENMNYDKIALAVCLGKEKTIVFAYNNANIERLKEKIKNGFCCKNNKSYIDMLKKNIKNIKIKKDIYKFCESLVD